MGAAVAKDDVAVQVETLGNRRPFVADKRRELAGVVELLRGIDDERGMVQICYAVAKELEDLGEGGRSFAHLKTGSDRRRKLMKYDVENDLETIEAIKKINRAYQP